MQFWKLAILKRRLASGSIPQREVFLYLLVMVALEALVAAVDEGELNNWDHAGSFAHVVTTVFGTTFAFSRNGGSAGVDFLPRYFALSWVLTVRLFVVLVPSSVGCFVVYDLISDVPEETSAGLTLLIAVIEIAFYWRLGHHISEVSRSHAAT